MAQAFVGRGTGGLRIGLTGRFGLSAAIVLVPVLALPALAQDAKPDAPKAGTPLRVELNKLEPAGDNCRTYLLVDNSKGEALKSLKLDLFAFDTEGVAQKRLAVELGPVGDKKTVVRLFDFPGLACPKIGKVLLNDVLACEGGDASRESCLERIETATKTSADFAR